jgi:hypothetical protein
MRSYQDRICNGAADTAAGTASWQHFTLTMFEVNPFRTQLQIA